MSALRARLAISRGVSPFLFFAIGSAPLRNNIRAEKRLFVVAHRCKGVSPLMSAEVGEPPFISRFCINGSASFGFKQIAAKCTGVRLYRPWLLALKSRAKAAN